MRKELPNLGAEAYSANTHKLTWRDGGWHRESLHWRYGIAFEALSLSTGDV
jgi:hypothetical protein